MKSKRTLILFLAGLAGGALPAFATDKADNANALDLGSSWLGGTPPGISDVASWSGSFTTLANLGASFTASTPVSWQGISIGNITGAGAGLVSIGGTGTAVTGSQITIGASGINMSAANQNAVINASTTVISGTQTWNIGTGRNVRFGTTGTGGANANLDGSGIITVMGGGLVDANQGGALGFADAAGFAGFSGKWVVESGTTLRGLRHGATAWGTNTASDAITLNGGTLATGGITGAVGNWSWTSNITLTAASTIDNQNISGTNRWLKLNGAITSSTGITFASTGVGTMSADNGFIITADNTTLSGSVTINSNAFVRVGGLGGTDITTGVGPTGNLGTAIITNNGTLTLSRNNTWTFANDVSGSGLLRIGVATGSATHIVTVSGNNSHTGGTTLQSAVTLNIGSATALGTGTFTIAGNGNFDNTTGSALSVTNNLTQSGGSPTFLGSNPITFGGTNLISGANRNITVNASSVTLTNGIGEDIAGRGYTKNGAGLLVMNGTSTYTGTTTVSAGTFALNGSTHASSAVTVALAGTLAGTGTANGNVTVNGTLSPGNSPGTFNVGGTLAMNNGSTLAYELGTVGGPSNDLTKVTGTATINATTNLNIVGGAGYDPATGGGGIYPIIDSATGISGSPANVAVGSGAPVNNAYVVTTNATDFTLNLALIEHAEASWDPTTSSDTGSTNLGAFPLSTGGGSDMQTVSALDLASPVAASLDGAAGGSLAGDVSLFSVSSFTGVTNLLEGTAGSSVTASFLGSATPGTYSVTLTLPKSLFSDDATTFTGLTGHTLGAVSGLDTTGASQSGDLTWTWTATVVPEPSSALLFASSLLLLFRRRR